MAASGAGAVYPRPLFAVSPLVAAVAPSKTVTIFSQTSDMKSRGEVVNAALCVGQPDFPPNPAVIAATAEAAAKGATTYTALLGTLELRKAICTYLKARARAAPTRGQSSGGAGARGCRARASARCVARTRGLSAQATCARVFACCVPAGLQGHAVRGG
jgi:hypothetical protein